MNTDDPDDPRNSLCRVEDTAHGLHRLGGSRSLENQRRIFDMSTQLSPLERHPSLSTPDAAAWLTAADPSSMVERSDDTTIAQGDPLRHLSQFPRQALVHKLNVHSTEQLLTLPDRQILKAIETSERCGPRGIAEVRRWLSEQRLANTEPVHTPIEAKARADDVLSLARHRIAAGIRSAIRDQ
jgi:hypothetical protein